MNTTTAIYHDQTVILKEGLVPDLLEVQSASEMYQSYGAHIPDENGYAVQIQAVFPGELEDHDDDELIRSLTEDGNGDVADALVAKARSVFAAMKEIETELDEAIEAATDGDLERTVDALSRASRLERDHGDDPATRQLASQLLDWVEDDEDEGYEEPDEVLFTANFGYALAVYRNGERVAFVPRLLTRDSEERRLVLRGNQVSLESFSVDRGWEEIESLGSINGLTRNQGYSSQGGLHDWEPYTPGTEPLSSVRELP